MLLRQGYDLPVLRISCRPGNPNVPGVAVFEAIRGTDAPQPVAECPLHELRAPARIADLPPPGAPPLRDADFVLPAEILAQIRRAAEEMGSSPTPPHRALWLDVTPPRGLLYLLPWERLLAPMGRPVLRLPNFLLQPRSSAETMQVVVCAPDAEGASADGRIGPAQARTSARTVVRICRDWARETGVRVQLHVFANPAVFRELRDQPGFDNEVTLHDPYQFKEPAQSGLVSDPWLGWVRDALAGAAVDVVHVLTPGCLVNGRGGVPLLQGSAAEDRWRRIVGATELTAFLGELGAWGLLLTGLGRRLTMPGLRELADTVSRQMPGVVAVHELADDDRQFAAAAELVAGTAADLTAALSAVTCWVHPAFSPVSHDDQDRLMVAASGHSILLGSNTRELLDRAATPSWLAAGSRFLETQQSLWLGDPGMQAGPPSAAPSGGSGAGTTDADVAAALGSVAALLDRHAAAYLADEGSS